MRKRKRNWPIRVFRYRAYPNDIPQSMWDVVHRQQRLWNRLVAIWRDYRTLQLTCGIVDTMDKKALWQQFDKLGRHEVAVSGLDWVNGPDVLDRFQIAIRTRRFPQFHGALQRVNIAHRYTSGGLPLAKIIDGRGQRVSLVSSANWEPVRTVHSPHSTHWRGRFTIGNDAIDFSLALHRPLPEGAVLKRASWLGERAGGRWFWYLALTVEEPPPAPRPAAAERPVAGLDLGWRVFADATKHDYLRVGMLADSDGRMIELRLPLRLRPNRVQEQRGLDSLDELQSAASACIEQGKALAKAPGTIGRRGLIKLLPELPEGDAALLRGLLDQHDRFYKLAANLRFRLIQRRRWYYRNIAQFLTRRYATIALEDDMKLPPLHARSDDPALRAAARYRNYAAVGELRAMIRRAAVAGDCTIGGLTRGTTATCNECGASVEPSGRLEVECPNGHRRDQDKRAALNLLAQIDGAAQTTKLRNSDGPVSWKALEMTDAIRTVVVEVPA